MRDQRVLDVGQGDLDPAPVDQLIAEAQHVQVAAGVDAGPVAGAQPAVMHGGGRLRVMPVAAGDHRARSCQVDVLKFWCRFFEGG
jgi:hypothetical protein